MFSFEILFIFLVYSTKNLHDNKKLISQRHIQHFKTSNIKRENKNLNKIIFFRNFFFVGNFNINTIRNK